MSEFTYIPPEPDGFFAGLIAKLSRDGHAEIVSIIRKGRCDIVTSQQFSRVRWNSFWSAIELRLPASIYQSEQMDYLEQNKEIIRKAANQIMPSNAGYDILDVRFLPDLEIGSESLGVEEELRTAIDEASSRLRELMIPDSLVEDAKDMSKVYMTTYCAENSIRNLIINVATERYGDGWMDNLTITSPMKSKISNRKRDAEQWRWISERGESDVYYLDFEDLANVIRNNWDIFQQYFPSQEWICVKITELSKVRNPVAHHGQIGPDEKHLVEISYRQILAQIQSVLH